MANFIASINGSDFLLKSLDEAEQLLRILSAATLVDENYIGESDSWESGYVLHLSNSDPRISVKLATSEPISYAEFKKRRDEATKTTARKADAEAA